MAWTEQLKGKEKISTQENINKQVNQNIDEILPKIKDPEKKGMLKDLKPVLWKSLNAELWKNTLKFFEKWKNKESAFQRFLITQPKEYLWFMNFCF